MTASKKKIINYKKLQLLIEFSLIWLNNLKLVECGKTNCFIWNFHFFPPLGIILLWPLKSNSPTIFLAPCLAEELQISQEGFDSFFQEHLQKLQKATISFIMYVCIVTGWNCFKTSGRKEGYRRPEVKLWIPQGGTKQEKFASWKLVSP
jgi:hypothetical protein